MLHKKSIISEIKRDLKSKGLLQATKNRFQNWEVVILACGPSAKYFHQLNHYFNASSTVFITIKQAHLLTSEVDILLFNSFNVTRISEPQDNHLKIYAESEALSWRKSRHHGKVFNSFDHKVIVKHVKRANYTQSIACDPNMTGLKLEESQPQKWGPGIMYELAIPLALSLGFKKIHTVGWEIFCTNDSNPHFYDNAMEDFTKISAVEKNKLIEALKSRFNLHWKLNSLRNIKDHWMGKRYNKVTPDRGESRVIKESLYYLEKKIKLEEKELIVWLHDGNKFKSYTPNELFEKYTSD